MIASRSERSRCALWLPALFALAAFAGGCANRSTHTTSASPLLPLELERAFVPSAGDHAAAGLARAALGDHRASMDRRLAALEREHVIAGRESKLGPLGRDLVNATLDDDDAYRQASRALLKNDLRDPILEARLDQAVADDPLRLARRRRRDSWEKLWARTFNAVSQPLGQSLMSGFITSPYVLAQSGAHYLASFSNDEPLGLTDRQALSLRKQYLAENPDSEDAPRLARQISKAHAKLVKTHQGRRIRDARLARRAGDHLMAFVQAERALILGPNAKASQIRDQSRAALEEERAWKQRALHSPGPPPRDSDSAFARDLATELLLTSSTADPLHRDTLVELSRRTTMLRDGEAEYVLAMAADEAGHEETARARLRRLAARDPDDSHMVRHARTLLDDPWQHPYQAFLEHRQRGRMKKLRWRLTGDAEGRTAYPNLPRSVRFVLEGPGLAQSILTSPLRLIFGQGQRKPDFQRNASLLAYRYLAKSPDGAHAADLLEWLYAYEKKRGNSIGALRIADFLPDYDDEERSELAEKAASQAVQGANRTARVDRRNQLLREVVRTWPDTPSGELAGHQARIEAENHTAQKIRVSRSFLEENPRVAGEEGLGINPLYLNGDADDGELHPLGVTFRGGLQLELHMLGESGDDDDPPTSVVRTVSQQRIARAAAMLDQTARNNQLIDADETLAHDADRDQFLERARLGLVDRPDRRPTAQSSYVYRSMRERYGLVRGRESILPFDLVLRGSFTALSLGAYPRWRKPKETPDAFLYR